MHIRVVDFWTFCSKLLLPAILFCILIWKMAKKNFFSMWPFLVAQFFNFKKHICIICQILKVVRFSFSIAQKNQAEEYITKIYNMLGFSSRIWYKIGHILPKWPIFQILAIFTIYGQFCTKCTKKTPTCYIFL